MSVVKFLFGPIFTRKNSYFLIPGRQGFTSGKNLHPTLSQPNIFIQKINISSLFSKTESLNVLNNLCNGILEMA